MSRKKKLIRFAEIHAFPHVYQNFTYEEPQLVGEEGEVNLKGNWATNHFKNDNPVVLELACGGGEYTVALAERYPDKNFIGVDVKGARIWKGAKNALDKGLKNAAFLRTRIEVIHHFFAQNEISEIWITFPDPFLRDSKSNRRLTSAWFLNIYRHFLQKEGIVHLKTDEKVLSDFTLEVIEHDENIKRLYYEEDIYSKPLVSDTLEIKTHYEMQHLAKGLTIKYIQFTIN